MTVFVSDTFTDTDAVTLIDHTPETGGAWIKNQGSASTNLDISSNTAVSGSTSGSNVLYSNSAPPGNVEYDINVDVFVGATDFGRAGLAARVLDSSNHYFAIYDNAGTDRLRLRRVQGGTTTLDTSNETLTKANAYDFKFEIKDATKKLYVDDVEKLSSVDNGLTAAGSAGILFFFMPTNANFDNFIAQDTASSGFAS